MNTLGRLFVVVVASTWICGGGVEATAAAQHKPANKVPSPVDSFKAIVEKYSTFYAKKPLLLRGETYSTSPTGKIFWVERIDSEKLKYDVTKTDSLVTPLVAYVDIELAISDNRAGGDLAKEYPMNGKGYSIYTGGYSAKADAWDSTAKPDSWHATFPGKTLNYHFAYAFQENKWALTGHEMAGPGSQGVSIISHFIEGGTNFDIAATEPENQPWASFFKSVGGK